ncbi:MAG: tetratricopeptide repeat protein, partial [Bifidobacteriales bacterium]|nr:tetratricopeptide repeat protein [Bifidobacteriales bacterium]
DPTALKKRIAENPKDYQAAYDLALVYNAENKRDDAADLLLGIMKADRAWNDDGARKQLLQFFEAWGAMDPATLTARRKLSSLLFS